MSEENAVGRKYREQRVTAGKEAPLEIRRPQFKAALDKLAGGELEALRKSYARYRELSKEVVSKGLTAEASGLELGDATAALDMRIEKYFEDGINAIEIAATSAFPYQAVCQLRLVYSYGTYIGTGWLADRQTVITVGHNIYSWNDEDQNSKSEWAQTVIVAPGRYESEFFGFGPYQLTDGITTTKEWQRAADAKSTGLTLDLGVLKLKEPASSSLRGFDIAVLDEATLLRTPLTVCGYPNDPKNTHQTGRRQWSCTGEITRITDTHLYYRLDTWGGHSGSPLWAIIDGTPKVVGIHMGGQEHDSNWAVRISENVAELINSWKAG